MIRQAIISDVEVIASLMMMAMDKIVYKLLDQEDENTAIDFLKRFILMTNNQYSHENIWVYEKDAQVLAMMNIYDGGQLQELRNPILNYIGQNRFGQFMIEDETEAGEFYIDTLAVSPDSRGLGIAHEMLEFAIDTYVCQHGKHLGLLVDSDNHHARQLYIRHGFSTQGFKNLLGERLEHLQFKNSF